MIKGLSWMAGGSTRSVFNLSFMRGNNIAGECAALAVRDSRCQLFLTWFALGSGGSICSVFQPQLCARQQHRW
jgi:hypothetical protein